MSSVLVATLVADPLKGRLTEAILDRAAQALRGIERRRWLDEGVAADLIFTGELKSKRVALEESLSDESIDVIVQLNRLGDGSRRVVDVSWVASRRQEDFSLVRLMHYEIDRTDPAHPRGAFVVHDLPPGFRDRLVEGGADVSLLEST